MSLSRADSIQLMPHPVDAASIPGALHRSTSPEPPSRHVEAVDMTGAMSYVNLAGIDASPTRAARKIGTASGTAGVPKVCTH